jgi:starch synthase
MPPCVKIKVLLAASEVAGFAKTGGLADVAASLPRALAERGHECAVILPLYRSVRTGPIQIRPTGQRLAIPVGGRTVAGALWRAALPHSSVPVYLVEQPDYFERDDPAAGRGLYQLSEPDGRKTDYADNCERFVFFSRAVLETLRLLDFWPDILHANDWQTGLVPVYLNQEYRHRPGYQRVRSLFTIHNIAYQGIFWHWDMNLTGLDWQLFNHHQLEFYGHLNLLKGGIVFADQLSTVSPTYAKEIQTPEYGCGLEGVLAERRDRLLGIVNGVDYREWNPVTDPHLPARYDADTLAPGKSHCKRALQSRFGLPERPNTPLLGMVSRLAEQKGVRLVGRSAEALLREDIQIVFLGEGEPAFHQMLSELRDRYPDRVGVRLAFDEVLAHQIEAGADIFLMPSRYEPAGLNQLYSLKYGTVPVVRATGGLADTITDCTAETVAAGTATGFVFAPYTASAFLDAVGRALDCYRHRPEVWRQLIETGIRQDWSWQHSAADYERLYVRLRDEARTQLVPSGA